MHYCPKCHRPLARPNAWHYCAEVDMDELFEGKAPELVLIFDRLLEQIVQWDEVGVSASKNCIIFIHKQTFLVIRPMKTQLDLKFFLQEHSLAHPISKCVAERQRFATHIRLKREEEVTAAVFKLIKQSYRFN